MEVINTTSTVDPTFYYNRLNNFMMNPIILVIIVVVVLIFIVFSLSLGSGNSATTDSYGYPSQQSESSGPNFIIIILAILAIFFLFNFFEYFFSINITAYIKNLFSPNSELEIVVNDPEGVKKQHSTTSKPHTTPKSQELEDEEYDCEDGECENDEDCEDDEECVDE